MTTYDEAEFREMQPEDLPFSPEAMTVGEIERHYSQARNKKGAIRILADLCATERQQIELLLSARGLLQAKTRAPSAKQQEYLERVVSLADAGKTGKEIAAELGKSENTIYAYCSAHGIQLQKKKRSVAPALYTPSPAPQKEEKKMAVNLYALVIDTIAELLARADKESADNAVDFVEQVRGVLALVRRINEEDEAE